MLNKTVIIEKTTDYDKTATQGMTHQVGISYYLQGEKFMW